MGTIIAPSALSVAVTATGHSLSWTDNSNNEHGFEVWVSYNGGAYSLLATTAKDVTTYAHTHSHQYYTLYKVRAKGGNLLSDYTNVSTIVLSSSLLTDIVSYWKCNDINSPVVDSLSAHNGTGNALTYSQTGKIGNAISMPGTTGYIDIGALSINVHTISFWAKRNTFAHNTFIYTILTGYNGVVVLETGDILYYLGGTIATWSGIWTDKTAFHHLIFINSVIGVSGKIELYFDGVSKGVKSVETYAISNLRFGNDSSLGFGYYGIIDEIGLWSKALAPEEVTDLYNSGTGKTYPF